MLKIVVDVNCQIGEGPLWHVHDRCIYWCDVPMGRLYRYCQETGVHEQIFEGEVIGGFTIQADGSLLLFMAGGVIKRWHAGELSATLVGIEEEKETRFNDIIADPLGRVFCGTLPGGSSPGRLYRLDNDGRYSKLLENIEGSNGMGFSMDRKYFYYSDSSTKKIYIFDYELESGAISNQRVFVKTGENDGIPDGLTVDAEGFVWSACWGAGCLIRYSPDGDIERRVQLPVAKVSSLTFGGIDYTDIYVTTAGGNNREIEGQEAGALFKINLGIRGVPEFNSRLLLTDYPSEV